MATPNTASERDVRRSQLSRATIRGILADLGHTPEPGARILDVGCGRGLVVQLLREDGYRAFGADVSDRFTATEEECVADGLASADERVFCKLDLDDYSFPYPDESFDFVLSDQLLEHVEELDLLLSECARVLRPGGHALHLFPPRWMVVEPHFYVPFGGALPYRWYYRLWASLGLRKPSQKGLSPTEVVEANLSYWRDHTCYRSAREIEVAFRRHGFSVRFVNELFVKNTPRAVHRTYPLLRIVPGSGKLVGSFLQLAVFATREA